MFDLRIFGCYLNCHECARLKSDKYLALYRILDEFLIEIIAQIDAAVT